MRIDGPNPLLGPALLAALAAKDEAFGSEKGLADQKLTPPPLPAAPTAAGTAIPLPATSVAMLVTLAAVDKPGERRRRAIAQAETGLDQLERLRDELATGTPTPERLRALAEWSQGFTVPDDPELAGIAREIELRVRVELAKHDVSL